MKEADAASGFAQELLRAARAVRQSAWAELTNAEIEDAGSQEFKNWICLAGVFADQRAHVIDYLDTWIFNSQKCFAVFE